MIESLRLHLVDVIDTRSGAETAGQAAGRPALLRASYLRAALPRASPRPSRRALAPRRRATTLRSGLRTEGLCERWSSSGAAGLASATSCEPWFASWVFLRAPPALRADVFGPWSSSRAPPVLRADVSRAVVFFRRAAGLASRRLAGRRLLRGPRRSCEPTLASSRLAAVVLRAAASSSGAPVVLASRGLPRRGATALGACPSSPSGSCSRRLLRAPPSSSGRSCARSSSGRAGLAGRLLASRAGLATARLARGRLAARATRLAPRRPGTGGAPRRASRGTRRRRNGDRTCCLSTLVDRRFADGGVAPRVVGHFGAVDVSLGESALDVLSLAGPAPILLGHQ